VVAQVSSSGSEMGAEGIRQAPSDSVYQAACKSLTCTDTREQGLRTLERPVRDQEAAGSNPTPPTR
jgi:hypothetical protein